jgi:hypothetical protein
MCPLNMKTYRRNDKIIFKIGEDSSTIIEKILKTLKELIKITENRHTTNFPVDSLKTFVNLCNSLVDSVDKKYVPNEYLDYVNTNKEVIGYFKEIENKIMKTVNVLEKKRTVLKSFKEEVDNLKDIL